MCPGAHCDRAAAGGSVDRKEIPEPSLFILRKKKKKPEASPGPFALWASVSSGLVLKMSPQLCIPEITSLDTESIARLSWGTRDAGQNQVPTILTRDYMWLRTQPRRTAVSIRQLCLSFRYSSLHRLPPTEELEQSGKL